MINQQLLLMPLVCSCSTGQHTMRKIWLLVLVMFYHGFPSMGISYTRPTTVNVGALLSFNSTVGRVAKVAIEAAVDDVNSNANILNGTTLKILMLDTKLSTGFLGIVDCMSFSNTFVFFFFFHSTLLSLVCMFLLIYFRSIKIDGE